MYIRKLILMTICLFNSAMSLASPQNGFGSYGGLISATEGGSSSKGLSLGADAQFVVTDKWSLNPYLMLSAEKNSASNNISDALVGLQARYWFSEWFIGGHIFEHDRIIYGNGNTQNSAYGVAGGMLAGFENSNGWGSEVQTDFFETAYPTSVKRNAIRLNLTYRWY
jgi:hypothetical protein